jgi:hypothetical protein
MFSISVMAVFTRASNKCCDGRSADDFEQARGAHATADAHGYDGVFYLAAAPDQSVAGHARRSSIRVTDRDQPLSFSGSMPSLSRQ